MPEITIMEVCGSHTAAIVKNGIRGLLPPHVRLVSGPGCPVCVTPAAYFAALTGNVLCFGDLIKFAPGARMIYSPLEAADIAKRAPDVQFLVAAVGFETTAPAYALLLKELEEQKIENVRLLTALKTMPAALKFICAHEAVDAFLCPGHVSVITGSGAYKRLFEKYKKPFVITGFEPENILLAIDRILHARPGVLNLYPQVVSKNGQARALELIDKYFEPSDAYWRGIGLIPGSGLVLKKAFKRFDAGDGEFFDSEAGACRCGEVMLGRIDPPDCPLFGGECAPAHPAGACMVSSEGACGIWLNGGRL
mgnify:CR=1 FL=1